MKPTPTLCLGLLASAALATAAVPAHADGFSKINAWNHGNSCLDNATEDDAKLQIWSCGGGSEQQWSYVYNSSTNSFSILNRNTGRCIAAQPGGQPVAMEPCDAGQAAQQWHVLAAQNPLGPPSGWFDVWQNQSNGLCLQTDSMRKGGRLYTLACDINYDYQRWHKQ